MIKTQEPPILTTGLRKKLDRIGHFIGNTPLYLLDYFSNQRIRIYAKLEWMQHGSSIKSRAAYQMIRDAVLTGKLSGSQKLLDATSGNTGIAFAAIGASLGIDVSLCIPKNVSKKRKQILKALGAKLIYTSPLEGTDGAQLVARQIYSESPSDYFYTDQYSNPANRRAHYLQTGPEIWKQTKGKITHFVCGLGTTGTFMGTSTYLHKADNSIRCIGLQPASPMHGLEGWKHLKSAMIPKIYDPFKPDELLEIDSLEAYRLIRSVARHEGLLISPSAAANLAGALKIKDRINSGTIVTVFADNNSKYDDINELPYK